MSTALADIPQPTQVTYRDYSSDYKAEAIALVKSNGGNVLGTAKQLGIDESTLRQWLRKADRYRNLSEVKQLQLADKFEANVHSLVDSIAEHDLAEASLSHKATALGILTDKMLLLRGQPTSISLNVERNSLTVVLQSAFDEDQL